MAELGTTDIFDKVAEFLAEGNQNLIFVLDRFCITGTLENLCSMGWGAS